SVHESAVGLSFSRCLRDHAQNFAAEFLAIFCRVKPKQYAADCLHAFTPPLRADGARPRASADSSVPLLCEAGRGLRPSICKPVCPATCLPARTFRSSHL